MLFNSLLQPPMPPQLLPLHTLNSINSKLLSHPSHLEKSSNVLQTFIDASASPSFSSWLRQLSNLNFTLLSPHSLLQKSKLDVSQQIRRLGLSVWSRQAVVEVEGCLLGIVLYLTMMKCWGYFTYQSRFR